MDFKDKDNGKAGVGTESFNACFLLFWWNIFKYIRDITIKCET